MKRFLVVLASLALFTSLALLGACEGDEAPTTQVMLEIDADDAVRARMKTLRILISVSDDGGETWRDKVEKTFSEGSAGLRDWRDFHWPARLGLVPESAADRLFSVRVQALDEDDELLVWQQAVAGFEVGRIKVLRMSLSSVCALELLACGDPECIGADECETCRNGECIDVEILSQLPDYDPNVESDGAVDLDGSVEGDGGTEDAGDGDAGDGGAPEDGGGDGQVDGGGEDGGCTDCDAEVPDPLTASVSQPIGLNEPIDIVFDGELEGETVNGTSVVVLRDGVAVPGSIDVDVNVVHFTPDDTLAPATTYRVELSSSIGAKDGRVLEATNIDATTAECTWTARDVATGTSPDIASSPDGFTVLAYDAPPTETPAPSVIWATTRHPTNTWEPPFKISATNASLSYFDPRVSANDAEQVGFTYYFDSSGYLYGGTAEPMEWTSAQICFRGGPPVTYDMLILASGMRDHACVASQELTVNGGTPLSSTTSAGPALAPFRDRTLVVWAEDTQLRTYTTYDSTIRNGLEVDVAPTGIAIASDPQHTSAVVVWEQSDASWPNVWSARLVDDDGDPTWSPALRVSNDTSAASDPAVALDGAGNAIVVWQQGSPSRVYAARLEPGGAWDEVTPLSDPALGAATDARIVVEPGGNAFAFWISDVTAGAELWVARYLVGESWQVEDRARLSAEAIESVTPEVSIDAHGYAHAAWREGTLIRSASCE